ncbi:MAG: hypothetical protein ABS36_18090 [Acidobacteria bacterium SCN 69-37]|nr:MAG: hypothetical protein ABS36_18090 [Acidobacteria bacterium SCN 69-37]
MREDVEVTAARSAVSSDQSPASSSVVTRTDIERRGTRVLDQVIATSPGVSAYRTRGMQDNETGIGLRGFSGRGTGQSRVLVLFDGQPMNNGYTGAVDWSSVPVSEVDRVEVVRGPFSALYGGNAMGGVVNVITRPVDRRSAEVFGQYGSQGTGTFVGRYADRLGRTGFSVGYEYSGTDGYETQEVLRPATAGSPTGGTPVTGVTRFATSTGGINYGVGFRGDNWYRRHAVRARVEQTFADRTVGSFQYIRQTSTQGFAPYRSTLRSADGQTIDNGAVVFQDPEAGDAWMRLTVTPTNYLGLPGGRDANMFQAQLLHTTAGDGLLRVQAGAFDTPRDWYASPGASATLSGGAGSQTIQDNRSLYGNVQWSAVRRRHAITLGTDTRRDTGRIEAWTTDDYLGGDPFLSRSTSAAGATFTQGLYVQDQFAAGDALQITAGARYDYWRAFDGETQTVADTPPAPFDSRSTSAVTGKIAAVYRAADDTILRASVGTSFRPPSVFELYRDTRLSTSLLLGNPDVDPERLTSWEAAVRQRMGRAVTLDATYYDSRVRDLIYRATDLDYDPTGATRRLLNAGEGRLRGLELGVAWRPATWLTIAPSYTFSDAVITRNDAVPTTVGMRLPFVPRHTASATAAGTWRALTLSGSLRYQSDVYSTDTNTDIVDGVPGSYNAFTELDASAGWRLTDRVSLQLSVENLLDEQYYMFYRNPGRLVLAGVRLRY